MGKHTSVSAVAVQDLHDLLLQHGVTTPEQLLAAGVQGAAMLDHSPGAPPPQEQRAEESQLLTLWQIAANNPQLPHIGLLIGQTFNPATHGVLASWLRQCSVVREALEVFQQHIALMNPSERWHLSESANAVVLEIAFAPDRHYPQAAIERSMSALLRWSQEMTGTPWRPLRCEFAYPRPSYHARYTELFGDHLTFDSSRNCLHLPQAFLDSPIPGASDYLKQMLKERAHNTLKQLQATNTFSGTVRQLIQASLPAGARIEHICQVLHITRPTLYRRLKQEGTSFSELSTDVRKELASILISQGQSVENATQQLGFKDASTFHRAFKRWFGQSPGACRGRPVEP